MESLCDLIVMVTGFDADVVASVVPVFIHGVVYPLSGTVAFIAIKKLWTASRATRKKVEEAADFVLDADDPAAPVEGPKELEAELVMEEASPALKAFLSSLGSEQARYDPSSRHLSAPGIAVGFGKEGQVAEIITDDTHLASVLPSGRDGWEWCEAASASLNRRAEVIERDRRLANLKAAIGIGKAHEKAVTPPQKPALDVDMEEGDVVTVKMVDGRLVPTDRMINVMGSYQNLPNPNRDGRSLKGGK